MVAVRRGGRAGGALPYRLVDPGSPGNHSVTDRPYRGQQGLRSEGELTMNDRAVPHGGLPARTRPDTLPRIVAVVPALDEAPSISRVVGGLLAQTGLPLAEVIVVD